MYAQPRTELHGGVLVAYRSSGALTTQITTPDTLAFGALSAPSQAYPWGIVVGAEFPAFATLGIVIGGEGGSFAYTQQSSRDVTFVSGDGTVPGRIQRNVVSSGLWFALHGGCSWYASDAIRVELLADALRVNRQVVSTDRIVTPEGATFVATGTVSRPSLGVTSADASQLAVRLGAELHMRFPLDRTWSVDPFLRIRRAIRSLDATARWLPHELAVGVRIGFSLHGPSDTVAATDTPVTTLVPPSPERTLALGPARTVSDTVVIVDRWSPHGRDTVFTSRTDVSRDTIRGSGDADTLVETVHTVVERHLVAPAPFLLMVTDVQVERALVDTKSALVTTFDVVSDTSYVVRLDIDVDGTRMHTRTVDASTLSVHILLRDIVPRLATRRQVRIDVYATATDAYGQMVRALPRQVVLRRRSGGGPLKVDVRR